MNLNGIYVRQGVSLAEMSKKQKQAAWNLMEKSLSAKGVQLSKDIIELAEKYAYMFFERYHLPWDFLIEEKYGEFRGFNFECVSELFDNQTINTLANGVEHRKDFLLSDNAH